MSSETASSPYDNGNIFAKIIDGEIPSFKVFENEHAIAFLDAFPMVKGHTLVVPKLKGYKSLIDMPEKACADFMQCVPQVARAVKDATGADGMNIISNSEPSSGQTVFHPHVHLVPRYTGDELLRFPPSAKQMITPDEATPLMNTIQQSLNKTTTQPGGN